MTKLRTGQTPPSHEFADALFDQAPLSMVVYDARGHIAAANAAFERLFGVRTADIPRDYCVLTDPQLATQGVAPFIARAFAGESVMTPPVKYSATLDGGVVTDTWTQAHLYPLLDASGATTAVVLLHVDLTARLDAEHELRAGEARLRVAMDVGGLGAWEWDIGSERVRWSATLERIHGIAPGSFGGTFDDYQRDVHPDDRDKVREAIRATIAGEPHDLSYRIIRPDGEIRWLNARGQLLRAADGSSPRLIGVCADVTDARRREQETALLTDIGTALGASLDYEGTLASLARIVVPVLGDYCIIDLLDPASGAMRRVATAQADPSFERVLAELREYPPDLASNGLVAITLKTGVPQLVTRVTALTLQAAASGNSRHADILRTLAPESVMCVPMVARGATIGTMLLAAAASGRRYSSADLAFAAELAQRAGLAVDNARLHHDALMAQEAAQAQARDVQLILSSISDPFVVYDREWRFRYVNEAAAAVFRSAVHPNFVSGLLGVVVWDAYPELRETQFETTMRQARDSGVPATFEEFDPQNRTWSEVRCYPLPDGGLATSWRDITTRKRAEEANQYLSSATALLASSLDYQQTLNALAQLVVPRLADWCAVDLLASDGSIERVAMAHANADRIKWGHELNARYPTNAAEASGIAQVIRSGQPEIAADITDEMLVAGIADSEYLRLLRSIGMRSAILVPLTVQGRTLGALSLVAAESGRRYDDADLQLAAELARRAALAVENARLHESALAAQREAAAQAAHTEQFRRVQELSPDPFALFAVIRDADGHVVDFEWVWANPAALAVQETTLDRLRGQTLLSRNPGVAGTSLFDGYVRAAETGVPYEDEVHYRNEWIDTWFRITAVRVEHHLALTFADISVRKRIEQRSKALFELTQALAHATSREAVGAVVLDRALPALGVTTGSLSEVDPLRQELVLIAERGHEGAAMRPWERYPLSADTPGAEAIRTGEMVTIASRQEWVERFPQHLQWADDAGVEGNAVVPLRIGDRAVGIIALQVRGPRVFDADERQFLLAFADQCAQALERVRLFDAERRSREELARVFAQAPVAIALTRGADHRFQIANPRYEALVGRSGIVGMTVAEALPELRDQGIFELMDEVLATGTPYVGMDTPVWLDRGPSREREEGYFTFVFQPVTLGGEHTDGIAIVANDVTPQVLARMESDRLRTAAESANLAKGDFLASMSHELRTPLNAIGGYTELLLLGVRGAITSEQRTDLERINHSQRHLLGVINDILNFARVDAGNVDFALQRVVVREVMDDVQPLVLPQLGAKALSFECDPGLPGLAMYADPEKVRQIVLNLLANAIKFTEAGGKIRMTAVAVDDWIALTVHDTGIGIAPDRLAAVFEPFVQVHRSLARPVEGTGLGLTISRELARAMEGDLTAESTPGVGSAFTLTLPRTES